MHSFSIVIETENLAKGELADLRACLASLDAQTLDVRRANEVLLIDCGQVEAATLASLRATYPWLVIHLAPAPLHYYEVKMLGAALATGDVLVIADSDVVYDRDWLETHVRAFDDPRVDFTSGETRIAIRGPYTLSLAATMFFPLRYRGATARSLIGNNAAARRSALLAHPIAHALPLYRAQSSLHGASIRRQGCTIRQVAAKGSHAPLDSIAAWALRFAISGADSVSAACYDVGAGGELTAHPTIGRRLRGLGEVLARKLGSSVARTTQACVDRPARLLYLPLALPITAGALLVFATGGLSSVVGSRAIWRWVRAFETSRPETVSAARAS